jgi:hypothetical protein
MPSSLDSARKVDHDDHVHKHISVGESPRSGGLAANMSPERRAAVEKTLKRKLDARCSLFVLIYIMNYLDRTLYFISSIDERRSRKV